jgi:tetrahydromethanopterin S-methyltransferase subunit G
MVKDDYKLVPTSEFDKITYELEKLRENSFGSKQHTKEVQTSITSLHRSINDLLDVFKQAHHEMTEEERESRIIKKEISPIFDQFQKVEDNQEIIANGIVVVSDSIAKLTHRINDIHKKFDEINNRLDKIERATKNTTPEVTRTTRRQYTTRQFAQGPDGQMSPVGGYQSPVMQDSFNGQMSGSDAFALDNPSPFGSTSMTSNFGADIPPLPQPSTQPLQKNELAKKPGLFGK